MAPDFPDPELPDPDLPDLEQEFRQTWSRYDPSRYARFLARTDDGSRTELLVRMLSAELEFQFQPPSTICRQRVEAVEDEDDERVRPSLQLFKLRFPELMNRQDLLLRLIVLEYALRLRYDAVPPNADSYLELCPAVANRLGTLLELTESKLHNLFENPPSEEARPLQKSDSTVRETETAQAIPISPLPYNLGCFLLTRCIGRGGMGYVHAAIDLRSAAQVAVKVMRRVDAWSVYRFNEEFTWLSQLYHPHVVRLYDAFNDGDVRYFSMELVEGKTIRDWFRRVPVTDETRWELFRKVLSQLASAIHFLHSQGVVHRDIKCSNVMITPRRRAVLLDLGLAMRQSEQAAAPIIDVDGERVIGTLQYLAPEGLCGKPLTPASDWYSFGVLMYEVMINEYPPISVDADAVAAEDKYIVDTDKLKGALSVCPPYLAELCFGLLSSNPASRPLGHSVLVALGGPIALEDPSSLGMLGRGDELQALNSAIRRLRGGESGVIRISGESGLGKSALLEYWQRLIDPHQVLLISVRCYRQDHTPLRLLNLLVQQLVRLLVELTDEFWIDPVRRHSRQIGRTFPQITQLVPSSRNDEPLKSLGPDNAAARRDASLEGVRELLAELSQHRPLTIVVDDAQWADSDSLDALCTWFQPNNDRQHGLIVFAVEQDEDSDVDPFPASCRSTLSQHIVMQPLADDTGRQLLRRMSEQTGIKPSPAVQTDILQRAGGNPFLLLELFRAFHQASREPIFSEERWLNSDPEQSTIRRFRLLPIQAENVLQYLAVAGQPLGFHQLQIVSRIAPNELQSALSYLDAQGWIRSYRDQLDSEVEIANGKYASLILASIPNERLERRHYRTARMLSAEVPPPWPRVGHHFWMANKKREAAACYMEAARIAAKASAFENALQFLERALIEEAQRTKHEHRNAMRLQADCLAGMGSSAKAATKYQQLSVEVSDSDEATLLECLAGEQRIRGGELDDGLKLLRSALAQLGITANRSYRLRQWLFPVQSIWRSRSRSFLRNWPHFTKTLDSNAPNPKPDKKGGTPLTNDPVPFSLLEQCLTRVSTPLTFLDSQLGSELVMRLAAIGRARGTPFDQAQVQLRYGIILSFAGPRWLSLAIKKLRTGRRLARSTGLTISRATAELCMYIWLMQRGEHVRAEARARSAIVLYQKSQPVAQWEIQFLNFGILSCRWQQGRVRDLQTLTGEFRRSAESRADAMSLFWMNVNAAILSDLSEDKVEQAQSALNVAAEVVSHHSFQSPRFLLWYSKILVNLYVGNARQAQQLLRKDWSSLDHSLVLKSNHFLWLALSARICTSLMLIRQDTAGSTAANNSALRDAHRSIAKLRKLRAPVFQQFARAFELAVDALSGKLAPEEQWSQAVAALHASQHHLMAHALQWHQAFHAASTQPQQLQQATEQAILDSGCAAPNKILNILLPLPQS